MIECERTPIWCIYNTSLLLNEPAVSPDFRLPKPIPLSEREDQQPRSLAFALIPLVALYETVPLRRRTMTLGGEDDNERPLLRSNELPPKNYHAMTQSARMQQLRQQKSRRSGLERRQSTATVLQGVMGQKPRKPSVAQTNGTTLLPQDRGTIPERHTFLYSMLNPLSNRWQARLFKKFISSVILVDLLMFVASTDPTIEKSVQFHFFTVGEGIVSCIFLVEYLLRLAVITEKSKFRKYGPVEGRLRYCVTFGAVIDLLATAPWFLERFTGWDLPTLTVLRIFRLFRILKTEGYIRAMDAVYRVVYYNSEILYVASLVCVFLTLVTSVLLYLLRPKDDQEQNFTSITATLYLSVLLLTGQGGPDGDLPWYTKTVILITSIFSVAMFAIPASMLTWGFEAEAERMARRARKRSQQEDDYMSNSSSDNTTDDEYFRLIAGDEEEDEGEEQPWMKQVREAFQSADHDHDGTLTLKETQDLIRNGGLQGSGSLQGDPSIIEARLETLEAKMASNSAKLDKILQLLNAK